LTLESQEVINLAATQDFGKPQSSHFAESGSSSPGVTLDNH
jgi:hypothetical protein